MNLCILCRFEPKVQSMLYLSKKLVSLATEEKQIYGLCPTTNFYEFVFIVQIYAKKRQQPIGGFNDQFPFKILFKVRSMYLSKKLVSLATEEKRNHKLLRIYVYCLELCLKRQQGLLQQSKRKLKRNPRSSRQLVWPEVQASKGEVIYYTNRNSTKISDQTPKSHFIFSC